MLSHLNRCYLYVTATNRCFSYVTATNRCYRPNRCPQDNSRSLRAHLRAMNGAAGDASSKGLGFRVSGLGSV